MRASITDWPATGIIMTCHDQVHVCHYVYYVVTGCRPFTRFVSFRSVPVSHSGFYNLPMHTALRHAHQLLKCQRLKICLLWCGRCFLQGPFQVANYARMIIPGSTWPLPLLTKSTRMASSATLPHDLLIRLANYGPPAHALWLTATSDI